MPSFDVVSQLDGHEVSNGVDQANRELTQRFDFKNTNFDTGRAADGQRRDGLNGLRFGWTLPIYRHVDDRIFYR